MSKIFIINGHQPYPFSPGKLNATLTELARKTLTAAGHEVRITQVAEGFEVDQEIDRHRWADVVIMQFPVNWMGTPWSLKKYMDEVYSAGMDGRLCHGDGRRSSAPKANYGMGGALRATRYMLSVTLNAPAEAFNDPKETFFAGTSVDDLLRPTHLNAKFFGMQQLPTFAIHDVMKDPQIDTDLRGYGDHLARVFQIAGES